MSMPLRGLESTECVRFYRAKLTDDPGELGLLGVERDSPGPKGLKNLAQGLPWDLFNA